MEAVCSSISLPLEGCKICFTGLRSSELKVAVRILNKLGGTLCNPTTDLPQDLHCLIVKRVGSRKHQISQRIKIPAVELQWLIDCQSSSSRLSFDNYRVRAFVGLTISFTGFTPEDRYKYQKMVQENGGNYSATLVMEQSTHLVAEQASGSKYLHAKAWGSVSIVSVKWLFDCVEKKEWLPEDYYAMHPPTKSSSLAAGRSSLSAAQSNIMGVNVEKVGRVSEKETSVISASSSSISSLAAPVPSVNVADLPLVGLVPAEKETVLKGETFFIAGFQPELRDYIVRLILVGGARRHHVLTLDVTKVLLGAYADERLCSEVRRHPCAAECISLSWLLLALFPREVLEGKTAQSTSAMPTTTASTSTTTVVAGNVMNDEVKAVITATDNIVINDRYVSGGADNQQQVSTESMKTSSSSNIDASLTVKSKDDPANIAHDVNIASVTAKSNKNDSPMSYDKQVESRSSSLEVQVAETETQFLPEDLCVSPSYNDDDGEEEKITEDNQKHVVKDEDKNEVEGTSSGRIIGEKEHLLHPTTTSQQSKQQLINKLKVNLAPTGKTGKVSEFPTNSSSHAVSVHNCPIEDQERLNSGSPASAADKDCTGGLTFQTIENKPEQPVTTINLSLDEASQAANSVNNADNKTVHAQERKPLHTPIIYPSPTTANPIVVPTFTSNSTESIQESSVLPLLSSSALVEPSSCLLSDHSTIVTNFPVPDPEIRPRKRHRPIQVPEFPGSLNYSQKFTASTSTSTVPATSTVTSKAPGDGTMLPNLTDDVEKDESVSENKENCFGRTLSHSSTVFAVPNASSKRPRRALSLGFRGNVPKSHLAASESIVIVTDQTDNDAFINRTGKCSDPPQYELQAQKQPLRQSVRQQRKRDVENSYDEESQLVMFDDTNDLYQL